MKKGFTLVELLAVIVILGVLSLISIPMITNVIKDSRKGAFKASVQSVFRAYETYELTYPIKEQEKLSILDLPLTHKESFLSGKVYRQEDVIKVENISNGIYCASGTLENLKMIEGNCDILDLTPPVIENITTEVTTNSIRVYTTYKEEESFLSKHEYRIALESENIEEKEWVRGDLLTSNLSTKLFTGLTLNTSYKIQVRFISTALENNTSEIREIQATTSSLEKPIFHVLTEKEYATSKEVKILYPNKENLIYEYSIDGENWLSVKEQEKYLIIEENQTIQARVRDGVNVVYADSCIISGIDKTKPIITLKKEGNNRLVIAVEPENTISGYRYIWYKNETMLTEETSDNLILTNLGNYKVKVITGAGVESESNEIQKSCTTQELLENAKNVQALDPDGNKRYVGASPNNYVKFNNELWRIVGVFNGQAKIVRNDNYFRGNWDESNSNNWATATLQKNLNEIFLSNISETDRNYIDKNHIWNLGGAENDKVNWTREKLYQWERRTDAYNERPTTWEGAIGLLYPSDFGYSTSSQMECIKKSMNFDWVDPDYIKNSWLVSDLWYWTITPLKDNTGLLLYFNSEGFIEHHFAFYNDSTLPTLYLKSNVNIINGTGTSQDPYLLGM